MTNRKCDTDTYVREHQLVDCALKELERVTCKEGGGSGAKVTDWRGALAAGPPRWITTEFQVVSYFLTHHGFESRVLPTSALVLSHVFALITVLSTNLKVVFVFGLFLFCCSLTCYSHRWTDTERLQVVNFKSGRGTIPNICYNLTNPK